MYLLTAFIHFAHPSPHLLKMLPDCPRATTYPPPHRSRPILLFILLRTRVIHLTVLKKICFTHQYHKLHCTSV